MMKTRWIAVFAMLALAASARVVAAQGLAVTGHIGSLGIGADVSLGIAPRVAVRAGANFQPYEPGWTLDELEYDLKLSSPSFTGMVDLYLTGPLRVSAGAVLFGSNAEVTARPTAPVEIGNTTYSPQQIGTLSGDIETDDFAPYIGIGLGRPPGSLGVGFSMDLGVAFQGKPDISLTATGPFASDPAFQAELRREEQLINDDAEPFQFYPVLSFGVSIAF